MSPRPLVASVFFGLAGLAVLAACQSTISAGFDGPVEAGPSFTGADTGAPVTSDGGGLCNSYDCPAPYATCPDTSGVCGTNLANDVMHCGSCDVACPTLPLLNNPLKASFICASGKCVILCRAGYGDCDGLVDDGCEVKLDDDPTNCGICGTVCAAGEICWKGACGCPAGYTQCGNDCVKLSEDDANCGSCGHACSEPAADAGAAVWPCGAGIEAPNTGFNCESAKCGLHCAPGFGNCNTDSCGDGCETSLGDDPNNCGACGNKCRDDQACVEGKCICEPDQTRCGTTCTDLQNDAENCGACDNVCPGLGTEGVASNGSPVCILGRCDYHCSPGRADCDHRIENGCEVDLDVDPLNCGACGASCDIPGGQPCAAGKCLTKPCDAGVVF